MKGTPRLLEHYRAKVVGEWMKRYGAKSPMAVPRIEKITLNMGVGEAIGDRKVIENAATELTALAGQKAVITRARKSVAGFKIREGYPIGCKVTLRRRMMYDFLDRLITIVLPRTRDFRGLSLRSFDGRGNYSLGVREQIAFPEVDYDKADALRGLDVTITTNARSDDRAREFLTEMGLPLRGN